MPLNVLLHGTLEEKATTKEVPYILFNHFFSETQQLFLSVQILILSKKPAAQNAFPYDHQATLYSSGMHGSIDNKKKNSRICNSSDFEKETDNKPVAGSKKTLKDMQLCRIGGPLV